jgi:hypothetical protein
MRSLWGFAFDQALSALLRLIWVKRAASVSSKLHKDARTIDACRSAW